MHGEILKLHRKGWRAKAIAEALGIPLARVWRSIARAYERAYRDGLATVGEAEGRIARAERRAVELEREVVSLKDEIDQGWNVALAPEERWRARARAIAEEPSPALRLEYLATPIERELPAKPRVIDLRTHKEA